MKLFRIIGLMIILLSLFALTGCKEAPEIPDEVTKYTIILENEDGSTYQTISDLLASSVIYLPTITKEGHVFTGWSDGTEAYISTFEVIGNQVLTATFENLYNEFSIETNDVNMTASISSYTGDETYLEIPEVIRGYLITEIGIRAFENSELVEVAIPASVKRIDFYAFANSDALKRVSFYGDYKGFMEQNFSIDQYYELLDGKNDECMIASGSISSGTYTFSEGCPISEVISVESITVGQSTYVTYHVILDFRFYDELNYVAIKDYAFANCDSLLSVEIPSRLSFFNPLIFNKSPNIESISIYGDDGLYTVVDEVVYSSDLKDLVFYPAGLLGEVFRIPVGTETIGLYAFSGNHLKTIRIPETVTDIAKNSFCYVSSLEQFTTFGDMTKYTVKDGILFKNEEDLYSYPANKPGRYYIIPDDVFFIYNYAFANNRNLENVYLNDHIYYIGERAFMGAQKLTRLELPRSLTNIGERMTIDSSITVIIVHRSFLLDGSITYIHSEGYIEGMPVYYVPDDSYENYTANFHWTFIGVEIHPISDLD